MIKGYTYLTKSKYNNIKKGNRLMYSIDGVMRKGGFVIDNKTIKKGYLVLCNPVLKKCWSLQLTQTKLRIYKKKSVSSIPK